MQLAQNSLTVDVVLEYACHFLDRYLLTSGFVNRAAHGAIAALSKQLDTLVVASNFPVGKLVDIESLSLHCSLLIFI